MKKIISLLLVFALVFSVVACSKKAETKGLEVEISKTKEGAVANSLFVNTLDINKYFGTFGIKIEMKKGLVQTLSQGGKVPIENPEAVEKLLSTIVGKISIEGKTLSDISNFTSVVDTNIQYGKDSLLEIKVKTDPKEYRYNVPQLLDKTFVLNINELMDMSKKNPAYKQPFDSQKLMLVLKEIYSLKTNDKEFRASFKQVLKDLSAETEKAFKKLNVVADPVDAKLKLEAGEIDVKEYTLKLGIMQIVDVVKEVVDGYQKNKEYGEHINKLLDNFKVAFEKEDKFKQLYADKNVNKEKFGKDIEEVKKQVKKALGDVEASKKLKTFIAQQSGQLAIVDSLVKFNIKVSLDKNQVMRASTYNLDTPYATVNLVGKLEAVNDNVKQKSIEFSKETIVFDEKNMDKLLEKEKSTLKSNLVKILEDKAYSSLYNDLQKGTDTLTGNDKKTLKLIVDMLSPAKLKEQINKM